MLAPLDGLQDLNLTTTALSPARKPGRSKRQGCSGVTVTSTRSTIATSRQ